MTIIIIIIPVLEIRKPKFGKLNNMLKVIQLLSGRVKNLNDLQSGFHKLTWNAPSRSSVSFSRAALWGYANHHLPTQEPSL